MPSPSKQPQRQDPGRKLQRLASLSAAAKALMSEQTTAQPADSAGSPNGVRQESFSLSASTQSSRVTPASGSVSNRPAGRASDTMDTVWWTLNSGTAAKVPQTHGRATDSAVASITQSRTQEGLQPAAFSQQQERIPGSNQQQDQNNTASGGVSAAMHSKPAFAGPVQNSMASTDKVLAGLQAQLSSLDRNELLLLAMQQVQQLQQRVQAKATGTSSAGSSRDVSPEPRNNGVQQGQLHNKVAIAQKAAAVDAVIAAAALSGAKSAGTEPGPLQLLSPAASAALDAAQHSVDTPTTAQVKAGINAAQAALEKAFTSRFTPGLESQRGAASAASDSNMSTSLQELQALVGTSEGSHEDHSKVTSATAEIPASATHAEGLGRLSAAYTSESYSSGPGSSPRQSNTGSPRSSQASPTNLDESSKPTQLPTRGKEYHNPVYSRLDLDGDGSTGVRNSASSQRPGTGESHCEPVSVSLENSQVLVADNAKEQQEPAGAAATAVAAAVAAGAQLGLQDTESAMEEESCSWGPEPMYQASDESVRIADLQAAREEGASSALAAVAAEAAESAVNAAAPTAVAATVESRPTVTAPAAAAPVGIQQHGAAGGQSAVQELPQAKVMELLQQLHMLQQEYGQSRVPEVPVQPTNTWASADELGAAARMQYSQDAASVAGLAEVLRAAVPQKTQQAVASVPAAASSRHYNHSAAPELPAAATDTGTLSKIAALQKAVTAVDLAVQERKRSLAAVASLLAASEPDGLQAVGSGVYVDTLQDLLQQLKQLEGTKQKLQHAADRMQQGCARDSSGVDAAAHVDAVSRSMQDRLSAAAALLHRSSNMSSGLSMEPVPALMATDSPGINSLRNTGSSGRREPQKAVGFRRSDVLNALHEEVVVSGSNPRMYGSGLQRRSRSNSPARDGEHRVDSLEGYAKIWSAQRSLESNSMGGHRDGSHHSHQKHPAVRPEPTGSTGQGHKHSASANAADTYGSYVYGPSSVSKKQLCVDSATDGADVEVSQYRKFPGKVGPNSAAGSWSNSLRRRSSYEVRPPQQRGPGGTSSKKLVVSKPASASIGTRGSGGQHGAFDTAGGLIAPSGTVSGIDASIASLKQKQQKLATLQQSVGRQRQQLQQLRARSPAPDRSAVQAYRSTTPERRPLSRSTTPERRPVSRSTTPERRPLSRSTTPERPPFRCSTTPERRPCSHSTTPERSPKPYAAPSKSPRSTGTASAGSASKPGAVYVGQYGTANNQDLRGGHQHSTNTTARHSQQQQQQRLSVGPSVRTGAYPKEGFYSSREQSVTAAGASSPSNSGKSDITMLQLMHVLADFQAGKIPEQDLRASLELILMSRGGQYSPLQSPHSMQPSRSPTPERLTPPDGNTFDGWQAWQQRQQLGGMGGFSSRSESPGRPDTSPTTRPNSTFGRQLSRMLMLVQDLNTGGQGAGQ